MKKSIILILNLSFMISVSFAQSEQYAEGFETEFLEYPMDGGLLGMPINGQGEPLVVSLTVTHIADQL